MFKIGEYLAKLQGRTWLSSSFAMWGPGTYCLIHALQKTKKAHMHVIIRVKQ